MIQNTAYRLVDYKVIENEHGDLLWEVHFGFGSLKRGKCFINGDILFIQPSDRTEPGFLIGEFVDQLYKLPKWKKTKYYCISYKIYDCKSDTRKPFLDGLDSKMQTEAILRKIESNQREFVKIDCKSSKVDTKTHTSYKLDRYEIIEKNNDHLFWKSHSGLRSTKVGRCYIDGSILFLEHGKKDSADILKREFIQQLISLPDWERTKYFCTNFTIYYSKTGAICRNLGVDSRSNIAGSKNDIVNRRRHVDRITLKTIIVSDGNTKDKLKAFFKFCNLVMMFVLKLLLEFFQVIYRTARALLDKWTRFRC